MQWYAIYRESDGFIEGTLNQKIIDESGLKQRGLAQTRISPEVNGETHRIDLQTLQAVEVEKSPLQKFSEEWPITRIIEAAKNPEDLKKFADEAKAQWLM